MKNVVLLGLVSFFSDVSTEMVYPLIPLYLTAALGATPMIIGIIEGIAESLASLLKVFSGYATDRWHHRKHAAFFGYAMGVLYKLILFFAGSWGIVLAARVTDRIGKGIRTAPRDALVCESADSDEIGKAFGIHKALDMAGAALGILIAYFLLLGLGGAGTGGAAEIRNIFLLAIIPAVFGLVILFFVKEKPKSTKPRPIVREKFWKKMRYLDANLKLYLAIVFVFTLGNSSNVFLLLRAQSLGFSNTDVVLLYFVYNIVAALMSIPFGKLSDRIGRKRVLVAGYVVFAAVYFGFAFASDSVSLIAVFVAYGFYTAMIAGVERAFVTEIAPPHLKGTMLRMLGTVAGIALLPASIIAGALWVAFGPIVTFCFGAALSLFAAIILMIFLGRMSSQATGTDTQADGD